MPILNDDDLANHLHRTFGVDDFGDLLMDYKYGPQLLSMVRNLVEDHLNGDMATVADYQKAVEQLVQRARDNHIERELGDE